MLYVVMGQWDHNITRRLEGAQSVRGCMAWEQGCVSRSRMSDAGGLLRPHHPACVSVWGWLHP
jgi:hypothetical protein